MVFYTGGNKTPSMARTHEHGKEGTESRPGDFDPDSIKNLNKPSDTVTLDDGSVMTVTPDQKRTPEGEPASVWMPDYTRRNQGTRRYNADRGGGYLQGVINPNESAFDAQLFNNLSKAEALSEWDTSTGYLSPELKASIEAFAKESGTPSSSGRGLWVKAINGSYAQSRKGNRVSPFEIIQGMVTEFDSKGPGRGSETLGGRSAYAGPVQSNVSSIMADEDIPRTLNEFATEMLGRNLTEKEMNKYTKKFKKQDRENEQISLRTPNGPAQSSTVTQEKVTRDTIARNIMQENPAYADQTINTDVLDIFAKRLGI